MRARLRSSLTLATLGLMLVVALLWGWQALTRPLPRVATLPVCVDTPIAAGDPVFPDQVAISVFNASARTGLASKTSSQMVTRGFVPADTGNAPKETEVAGVQIWADDPENAAVVLVREQFHNARVVPGRALGKGVVVVVGDGFQNLKARKKSPQSVAAATAAWICSPPGTATP